MGEGLRPDSAAQAGSERELCALVIDFADGDSELFKPSKRVRLAESVDGAE